jgi:hypothetical protein
VQLLQLKLPPSANGAPLRFNPAQKTRGAANPRILSTARNRGAQTLIVPDAPPDLKLDHSVPLPFALPGLETHFAPELATAPPASAFTEANPARKANVLSLPDDPRITAATVLIPKVNQSADVSDGLSGSLQPASVEARLQTAQARPLGNISNGTGDSTNAKELQLNALGKFTRLDLPPDGGFQASVLGASISEQYPEIATALSGKIVSTVYLKVGRGRNWTLEFWAPGAPVEAPWAYEIYSPGDLQMPPETESVLIGGTLNTSGRLENLQLLLPPEWPQKDVVFRLLEHWKFRPAARSGEPVAVQVLLAIPQRQEEERQ